MVQTVNGGPAYKVSFCYHFQAFKKEVNTLKFQRVEKTEEGNDIYLWHYDQRQWWFTASDPFQNNNALGYIHINSGGKQEL